MSITKLFNVTERQSLEVRGGVHQRVEHADSERPDSLDRFQSRRGQLVRRGRATFSWV